MITQTKFNFYEYENNRLQSLTLFLWRKQIQGGQQLQHESAKGNYSRPTWDNRGLNLDPLSGNPMMYLLATNNFFITVYNAIITYDISLIKAVPKIINTINNKISYEKKQQKTDHDLSDINNKFHNLLHKR